MVRMKETEKKWEQEARFFFFFFCFFFFSAFGSPSGKRLLWWCETKVSISFEDLTVVKMARCLTKPAVTSFLSGRPSDFGVGVIWGK